MAVRIGAGVGLTNMSSVDTLASYTRDRDKYGPTKTKTVTIRFEQRLRGVLQRLNATIRKAIIEDDILNLESGGRDTLAVEAPEPFNTQSDPATTAQFLQWMRRQLENELLTVISKDENAFIRKGFVLGAALGQEQLQDAGLELTTTEIEELLEEDRFDTALQELFTRSYENLESIEEAMVPAVRNELLTGYREGIGPREMARNITDRVDKIGKHRATLLARTEIINAHTQGTVNRYKQARDEEGVDIGLRHVGRLTAQDPDVCPFCRRASDDVFTIEEMTTTSALFRGQVYRLQPPSHPNGRCTLVPEIGVNQDDLAPLTERVPGQLVT